MYFLQCNFHEDMFSKKHALLKQARNRKTKDSYTFGGVKISRKFERSDSMRHERIPKRSCPMSGSVEVSEVEICKQLVREALLSHQFRFRRK